MDTIDESSTDSSNDLNNEFYTLYVQGTNSRNIGGLSTESKESKDDKIPIGGCWLCWGLTSQSTIPIGGDDTVKRPSGDKHGSDLQNMVDKGSSGGEKESDLQTMADKETVNV